MPQWLLFSGGFLLALLFPVLVRQYLCFRIIVPTASMAPGIRPGDHVIVWRLRRTGGLRRGDVLVFRSTPRQKGDGSLLMVKRLVGLPQETVKLVSGQVLVNGTALPEDYLSYQSSFDGSFTIPKDCYFFLGDNRSASHDARYWEDPFVHRREVIARAGIRIWPPGRVGLIQ